MTSRLVAVYQWVSPGCFAVAALLVHLGANPEPVLQGWTGALYWATCGALSATGMIAAVLGLFAAQQHLRVVQAQLKVASSKTSAAQRSVPGKLHS